MKETLGCFCESRSKVVLDEVKKLGDGNDVGRKRVETDGTSYRLVDLGEKKRHGCVVGVVEAMRTKLGDEVLIRYI